LQVVAVFFLTRRMNIHPPGEYIFWVANNLPKIRKLGREILLFFCFFFLLVRSGRLINYDTRASWLSSRRNDAKKVWVTLGVYIRRPAHVITK
jgi:hypothetical protein